MDFKVAGSRNKVSALQMDIKIEGITLINYASCVKSSEKRTSAYFRGNGKCN